MNLAAQRAQAIDEIVELERQRRALDASIDEKLQALSLTYSDTTTEFHTISRMYRCGESDIGWCVYNADDEGCIFCGAPEDRQ